MDPSEAGRRRVFVLIIGTLLLIGVATVVRNGDSTAAGPSATIAVSSATGAPATTSTSTPSPTDAAMSPAWLAWISGSLPEGFAAEAADTPALGTTVVVAGDTRWLRVSHDAGGKVIDHPTPPYEIPIDAFAVDPNAYMPFIPEVDREQVAAALDNGKAVLGSSSAGLRRIGVGGTLTFPQATVEVGAILPDDVVGWSEMLVSRTTGSKLGIQDDRYLLSLPPAGMTENRFAHILASLIPDDPVRTVPPGGSTYMRIASGVDPPVVIKQAFGEFAAYPRSDDPAYLNMSPLWYDAHIQTKTVPLLGAVTCNQTLFPMLVGALDDVAAAGLGGEIHTYSGCYAARTVARSDTAPPSQHAYGAAIDINAPENPYGAAPTMDPRIVKIFERWGFLWGGDYLTPDGMHFEYGGGPDPTS